MTKESVKSRGFLHPPYKYLHFTAESAESAEPAENIESQENHLSHLSALRALGGKQVLYFMKSRGVFAKAIKGSRNQKYSSLFTSAAAPF